MNKICTHFLAFLVCTFLSGNLFAYELSDDIKLQLSEITNGNLKCGSLEIPVVEKIAKHFGVHLIESAYMGGGDEIRTQVEACGYDMDKHTYRTGVLVN